MSKDLVIPSNYITLQISVESGNSKLWSITRKRNIEKSKVGSVVIAGGNCNIILVAKHRLNPPKLKSEQG